MSLTRQQVADIADYARIALDDDELDHMTAYMNDAIDNVLAPVLDMDLQGVEPVFHPIGDLSNVMREDELRQGLPVQEALRNAADSQGRSFRVPSILGTSEE